jgi:hypothetical protein
MSDPFSSAAFDAELVAFGIGQRDPAGAVGAYVVGDQLAPSAVSLVTYSSLIPWTGTTSRCSRFFTVLLSVVDENSQEPQPPVTLSGSVCQARSTCEGR